MSTSLNTPIDTYAGLLDDAALFPPGELPLPAAVPAHHEHRAAWYREMVGPFVVPAPRLGELAAVLDGRPIELSLTVPGGPAALPSAVQEAAALSGARLAAVEIVLPEGVPVTGLLAALDQHLADDVTGYVEVPRDDRRNVVLDALAGTRYRAKFRTGGVVADAHPGEAELADAILGAVGRAVPFKCTAGLHHAIRHTDGSFEQHGFLNVLLATDAALRGADHDRVADLLAERSGGVVATWTGGLGGERLAAARTRFVSFGTCSVTDPVTDLVALGLVRESWSERV